ncbi:Peptidase S24-like protein [Fusobacterium necrophorum subsp. funduliforme]|uniref:XRE family transcriptional regulator n=1 Tax=Fusobacterium necrophorum TaxID=859 RepID=UPI00370E716F
MEKNNLSKNVGKKITTLRKESSLTQGELGKIIGIATQSVLKYENGDRLVPLDVLVKIANYFKVSLSIFFEENVKITDKTTKIPVVSVVSAGNGTFGVDDITNWIEFSENIFPPCDFATTVTGNSMEPKIYDSDILLIKKTETLDSGDIGIFKIDDNVFCKKLQLNTLTNEVILKSLNSEYPARYLSKEELENFKIIGKVVGKIDYNF